MPQRSPALTGNSFLTTIDTTSGPMWQPLEMLATLVWQRPDLPQFHPDEFMNMAVVRGTRQRVTIHLYKHIDTRRYLNLDDGGHAYAFVPRASDTFSADTGGRYQRHRSLIDALDGAGLRMFETTGLFRSFPPAQWPPAC